MSGKDRAEASPDVAVARSRVHPTRLFPLALGALGVVFGDIGTSPLYAFKECLHGPHGVAATPENVLGVLSLIFWSLTFVVTVKYLTFMAPRSISDESHDVCGSLGAQSYPHRHLTDLRE